MTSYQVEKTSNKKKMKQKTKWTGYVMKPKFRNRKDLIEVSEITIIAPFLEKKVLVGQFDVAFRKLLKMMMNLKEEEFASDEDTGKVLGEIQKMKQILKDKYFHQIEMETYRVFVRKARFLENEMKQFMMEQKQKKMFYQKQMEQQFYEERGRGR